MDYKILQENIGIKSLKDVVLQNREMTKGDCEFMLNPTAEYVENPFKLKNMSEAIALFISELDNESQIGIVPDTDVDGYTSSALLLNYLYDEKTNLDFSNGILYNGAFCAGTCQL